MGRLHIDLFVTLDGVAQAPGGPDEDPSGGFPFGGWQAPLMDDVVGREVMAGIAAMDALLLGRRTYDIFAGYWPHHDDEIGRQLNAVPKYVASRGTPDLGWSGSHAARPRPRRGGPGGAGPAREHPRHRQRRPRPDAAGRAAVRRADAVGLPDRARPGEEGLPRRRPAVRAHPARAARWRGAPGRSSCATARRVPTPSTGDMTRDDGGA